MSSGWFDCTEPSLTTSLEGKQFVQGTYALVRGSSRFAEFGVVQAHRTSSNLLEQHNHRDYNVCRVHPHEFGVVRLCRTFSTLIFTGETRFAGF